MIAKGGITSSDVASRGLEIGRAMVRPDAARHVTVGADRRPRARYSHGIVFAGTSAPRNPRRRRQHALQPRQMPSVPVKKGKTHEYPTLPSWVSERWPAWRRGSEKFSVRGYDISGERLALAEQAGVAADGRCRTTPPPGRTWFCWRCATRAQLDEGTPTARMVVEVLPPGAVVVLTSTVGIDANVRQVAVQLAEASCTGRCPDPGGPVRGQRGAICW